MGDLEHLKNEISIEKTNGISWQLLAKKLHPTPAVCGVPFRFAQQYILDNENFDRKYYSGYLGPVNMAGETNLYVNLRCMQATKKSLLLYAGCGITALSNPENEWEETNAKLSLLQQLLEP